MRIRCRDTDLRAALMEVVPETGPGLVFVAQDAFGDWREAEEELVEAFGATQDEALENGPVVYVVPTEALIGRSAPLAAAVADGLLAGMRSIAFERQRFDGYATLVSVGSGADDTSVADAVRLLLSTRGSNGQPFMVGSEHLGAALP